MVDGLNLYCKKKFNENIIIETLGFERDEILFIEDTNGWLRKSKESIVVEYKGLFDDEDDEDYPGYHFYEVTLFKDNIKNKFNSLKKLDIIVDFD